MSLSARAFIIIVFGTMALSFVLTTAVLAWEFRGQDWLTIANFYSHLFIFFPTFGIVTLIAFYTPACVFVDLYLHHVPWGQYRFIVGFIVLAAASIGLAQMLTASDERSIFPSVTTQPAMLPEREILKICLKCREKCALSTKPASSPTSVIERLVFCSNHSA